MNRLQIGLEAVQQELELSLAQFQEILKWLNLRAELLPKDYSMKRERLHSTQGLASCGQSSQLVMSNSRHLAVCIGCGELPMSQCQAIPNWLGDQEKMIQSLSMQKRVARAASSSQRLLMAVCIHLAILGNYLSAHLPQFQFYRGKSARQSSLFSDHWTQCQRVKLLSIHYQRTLQQVGKSQAMITMQRRLGKIFLNQRAGIKYLHQGA